MTYLSEFLYKSNEFLKFIQLCRNPLLFIAIKIVIKE